MERYPAVVELHIFRIVQQAVTNAVRHARATMITISGHLQTGALQITVQDNGIGLPDRNYLELAGLLKRKHFGLAGMHERAAIIGAQLAIESTPETGTTISIAWKQESVELY
jgi:signal transduction histidine kinase